MGAVRAAGWLLGHVLLYLVLCLVGWLTAALLLQGTGTGSWEVRYLWFVWLLVYFYGIPFGLPTLLVLVVLRFVGQCVSARRFRQTALIVLPLIPIVLPIELPPSPQYGAQLLIQVPIQVAFALLLRQPLADVDDDGELLTAWGLTKPNVKPPRERWDDAEALSTAGAAAGPARSWYAVLLGVLLWLVLLFAGGHPLLLELIPLGAQRPARPIAGPGEAVDFVADPNRQYLIYQDRTRPADEGEICRYGGTYGYRHGSWVWSRPPERVTYDGRVYRYRGVVSGVDGPFDMSCDTGPLLVTDTSLNRPSPAGPAAVAVLSLPVLGIVYVAWARRRARTLRRGGGQTPTTETEAAD